MRPERAGRSAGVLRRLRPTGDDRPPFVEGLVLGAVVGAAIAGSTLWARLREARRRVPETSARSHADQGVTTSPTDR